ncbi:PREDICTED: uncharacterized protein LOC18592617 [Theobroma cacao]|uniref:Uncharacterized protein LOC18592617 n=1 Tax=Theobroma cacao TaxID=3641 RepID=A0AB32WSY6_THECC|nr:PREDICTED: uncharacterized protein LOC18592617 [Theobroma cacao]
MEQVLELARIRVAIWANAKWPRIYPSILEVYHQPPTQSQLTKKSQERKGIIWEKPDQGQMKFNVDGTARRCPGPTRIGEILRGCSREAKIIFPKAHGEADSSLAKMMVVKEALLIFSVSQRNENHKLLIESDSSNIVKWTKHLNLAPWRMRQLNL